MDKYYGDKLIVEIKDHPTMEDHQILVFKDGSKQSLTKETIRATVTDKPIDLTALRNARCFPVVAETLKLWHKLDIHIEDVDFIVTRATMSLNESLKSANEKLWGVDEQHKLMSDVNAVLTKEDGAVASPYAAPESPAAPTAKVA